MKEERIYNRKHEKFEINTTMKNYMNVEELKDKLFSINHSRANNYFVRTESKTFNYREPNKVKIAIRENDDCKKEKQYKLVYKEDKLIQRLNLEVIESSWTVVKQTNYQYIFY